MLQNLPGKEWNEHFPDSVLQKAITYLEDGQILFFPELSFSLSSNEQKFLSPDYADPHAKNIGYYVKNHKLWGVRHLTDKERDELKTMLDRFSQSTFNLIKEILPRYAHQLIMGRTSFRPIQISDRVTSYRKDDKRLHVDAFPSCPNQGKRILRVFCNINPHQEDRIWRTGEPFEEVANTFLPKISKPFPGQSTLLRLLKITRSYRTLYDHYMLHLHDLMKADEAYQKNANQREIRFPPNSAWIVQTDHVSHAAMKGQYVLEQTFYLPIKAMQDESKSPLRILEKILNKPLV